MPSKMITLRVMKSVNTSSYQIVFTIPVVLSCSYAVQAFYVYQGLDVIFIQLHSRLSV